mgnify:CR=1 FL=1
MRQLHVDREDDPAPGIRILKPQDHSAKPDLSYTLEPEKAPRMLVYGKKCLQNTMRLDDPISNDQEGNGPTPATARHK